MKKISKVESLEGKVFESEEIKLTYTEEMVKRIAQVTLDNRTFTEYKLNNGMSESYLYIRNTAQFTFWEVSLTKLGVENTVIKEEVEEVQRLATLADALQEQISWTDVDIEGSSYIELEDEESVYMGYAKDGYVYMPNKFYNPLTASKAHVDTVASFITFTSTLRIARDEWQVSTSRDVELNNNILEAYGENLSTSEEHILARYKRGENIIYKFAEDKIYEFTKVSSDYNDLIMYRTTEIKPEDECKYEKYIPNKKTSGVTDTINSPFSFFNY